MYINFVNLTFVCIIIKEEYIFLDETKRQKKQSKRESSFANIDGFGREAACTAGDTRNGYGKTRSVSIKCIVTTYVCVWCCRGKSTRIASRGKVNARKRNYMKSDGEVCEHDGSFFKKSRRGRLKLNKTPRKQCITMFADPDVLAYLKKDGHVWQTRFENTLRRAIGL